MSEKHPITMTHTGVECVNCAFVEAEMRRVQGLVEIQNQNISRLRAEVERLRKRVEEVERLRKRVEELEEAISKHMKHGAECGIAPFDRELWSHLESVRNVERARRGEPLEEGR